MSLEVIPRQGTTEVITMEGTAKFEGDVGPRGPQGPKGDKGDTGERGPQGIQGPQGNVGPQGPKGDKGDRGEQGIQGIKGDTGVQGPQGIQGPVGPQGTKGDTGERGPQGIQGPKGDTGAQGIQGEKGDKGDTGEQGPQGLQGIQGPKGDTGEQGIQGLKGDKGDTGEQGIQGIPGNPGDDGFSPTVATSKVGKITTITITDVQGTHTATIRDGEDGQGSGDMLKAVYDTDNDGIVDNAEKVNNHTVNADVPANAKFTDTTDHSLLTNLSYANSGHTGFQKEITNANKLDYSLIDNTPTIPTVPTNVSAFTNDAGYVTNAYHDSTKVDKVTGKQLSSNDYTTIEKNKLAGIEANAEVNIVETVKVNGTSLVPSEKTVNVTVPTKTSDITNDSGFIDNSYHDNTKQNTLVSGTNIKTINGNSVLGSGNIEIQSGGGAWGSITGTLSNQTDLNTALTNKVGNDANTNIPIYNVWYGTQAQYEAISSKDTNTLYFTIEG